MDRQDQTLSRSVPLSIMTGSDCYGRWTLAKPWSKNGLNVTCAISRTEREAEEAKTREYI